MRGHQPLAILDEAADGLRRVRGLKRLALAAGLGAASALAFEPWRAFPLMLFAYGALVLLFDGAAMGRRQRRDATLIGWAYGFGFFLVGCYWIGYAFLVDAAAHAWQLPFVAVLLPAGLGLFFALAGFLSSLHWPSGVQRIFSFAVVFLLTEWLRGHILTGFPWNLPAYGWGASLALLQSSALFGVYGLSLLTLLFGASLALLAPGNPPRAWRFPAALALLFLALWGNGTARLAYAGTATVPGVQLRLVQPATPQSEKYDPQFTVRNWRRLIDLSAAEADVAPTLIVWPEAAPPFVPARVPQAMADIAALTRNGATLMSGVVRIEGAGPGASYYNSFAAYGRGGAVLATYDKFHLVPFGEYLPLEGVLRAIGLSEIAADRGFSSGAGPQTLSVPGVPPFGPLICYEVIFPQEVTATPRPAWLVNMTDDSWFGPNTGPMQHLLIARVRAIEEGLPIARAANSGISAIVDGYGRIRQSLALGLRGTLDGPLPVALAPTPFARYGNVILFLLVLVCAGAALWPLKAYKP